ncbi:MAG: DUF222 domain-containing protein [Motilibacteraceae bacterium]
MSEDVAPPPQHALPDALAALGEAVARAVAAPLWQLESGQLGPSVQLVVSLENQLAALRLSLVKEADDRSVADALHARTTPFWLAQLLTIDHVDAAKQVRLAREGSDQVLAAIADGSVCETKALAIVDGLRLIKRIGTVTVADVEDGEEFLLERAPELTRKGLVTAAARIADVLDPDRGKKLDEDEKLAHSLREVAITPDVGTDGAMYRISGRLTKETASLLMTTLDAVMRTEAENDEESALPRSARRTLPQRRADALATLVRLAADHDDLPLRHGEPVQALITMPLQTLESRTTAAGLVDADTGQPAGYLPGLTEHGDRLAPATLRRLACDAKLVPVVLGSRGQPLDLGSRGQPLDLGREVRLATATIYRALAVEFGGCCGIGCNAPPTHTTAHHLDHWADDGPTSLTNSAPLCGHEHWLVHEGGWDLRRTSEPGVVEWRPPAWIDPARPWIRREPPPR